MTATAPEQLPRGRHNLPPLFVRIHQARRILVALQKIVEAEGYDACTVSRIVERAGVSRRTFYELYPDRATAFLEAWKDVLAPDEVPVGVPELDAAGWRLVRRPGAA